MSKKKQKPQPTPEQVRCDQILDAIDETLRWADGPIPDHADFRKLAGCVKDLCTLVRAAVGPPDSDFGED